VLVLLATGLMAWALRPAASKSVALAQPPKALWPEAQWRKT
jgi:hypothetical protein